MSAGWAEATFVTSCDDARGVAICDVQESARQRSKDIVDRAYGKKACATYNDFRELLERKDIDALMLATGERWTPYIGAGAARRGIHMYYEKPSSLTVEEAKAIRAAVQRQRVTFQFGTQQRSGVYFRTACELAPNGKIGQLQKVAIGCSGATQNARRPEEPRDPPAGFDWDMWLGPSSWQPYSDASVSVLWLAIYGKLLNRAAAMQRYPREWGGTGCLNGVIVIGRRAAFG